MLRQLRRIAGLSLLGLVLVACSGNEPDITPDAVGDVGETPTETATAQPPTAPSATPIPLPTATATPLPPTNTNTPSPTDTPVVTATPTLIKPTATPVAETPATIETTSAEGSDLSELDGLLLMTESEGRAAALTSLHIDQRINANFAGLLQTTTQNCRVQRETADQVTASYCQNQTEVSFGGTNPITSTLELVTIGDRSWQRPENGDWQEFNLEESLAEEGFAAGNLDELRLSEFVEEAEVVGETTINGQVAYEVAFSMDVEAYFSYIFGEEAGQEFLESMDESNGIGTVWIGQDDRLPHKATLLMEFLVDGQNVTIESQIAYSDFNVPVDIPDPEAE